MNRVGRALLPLAVLTVLALVVLIGQFLLKMLGILLLAFPFLFSLTVLSLLVWYLRSLAVDAPNDSYWTL